jgi:hypothetical protein
VSKLEEYQQRYQAAMHAVQTGISYRMEYDPKFVEQKHQLVGVVSNEVTDRAQNALLMRRGITERQLEQAALARLLIEKGVFTEEEYSHALARFAEQEQAAYEHELSRHYGTKITLA